MQEHVKIYFVTFRLIVKSVTWNKESNELFDFESQDVVKNMFECKNAGSFIKRSEILKFIHANEKLPGDNKTRVVVHLDCDLKEFTLRRQADDQAALASFVNRTDTPWIIVKNLRKSDVQVEAGVKYRLIAGDVIKLGRIKLKLMEIKLDSRLEDSVENQTKQFNSKVIEHSNRQVSPQIPVDIPNDAPDIELQTLSAKRKKRQNLCRICYCDETEVESPLIQPCSCSGTMKYIHFICLQKWLKSKVVIKASTGENSVCYTLKQVECELCKTLLPGI
jgi:hypothetical protein